MNISNAELEYREKYAYLPSTQNELLEYLEKNLKLDKNKIEALRDGLDAFITGEIGHSSYHFVKESCINVIAGGHYQTETIGVQQVMKKLAKETGIQTTFIDIPTNL